MKCIVGFWIWHETLEESWRMHQPKHCEYNDEAEVNSSNILSDKSYQASFKTFWQINIDLDIDIQVFIYIYIYIF